MVVSNMSSYYDISCRCKIKWPLERGELELKIKNSRGLLEKATFQMSKPWLFKFFLSQQYLLTLFWKRVQV